MVGSEDDPRAGVSNYGKRHTSGALTPDNGGVGIARPDFDTLTGGQKQPAGGTWPAGTIIGPNGVVLRPGQKGDGPRNEIPGNGKKLPETLHY